MATDDPGRALQRDVAEYVLSRSASVVRRTDELIAEARARGDVRAVNGWLDFRNRWAEVYRACERVFWGDD